MLSLLRFPLLFIPAVLLHLLVLGSQTGSEQELFSMTLPSGAEFSLRWFEILLGLGLAMLYFEVLKSSYAGPGKVIDHMLSLVLFVVLLLEMLLAPFAADRGFLLLTLLCLFDVLAGFTVAIAVAQRDIGVIR